MSKQSNIKSMSWFYLLAIVLAGIMTFANLTGWRVFTFNSQQAWGASGPGYHK